MLVVYSGPEYMCIGAVWIDVFIFRYNDID